MPTSNAVLRSLGPGLQEVKPFLRPLILPRGKHLAEPGDPIAQVYFPERGIVSSRMIFETNHEIELVTTGRNNAVGILAALGFPKSITRDVCTTETQGWALQVSDFQMVLKRVPEVEEAIRRFCYAQMTYAVRTATCNGVHTTEQRLARWLLIAAELTERDGVRLSQEELASILGVGRNHLNPLLQRLRRDGLIEIGRQRIELLAPERLGQRTCECHELLHRAMRVDLPDPRAPAGEAAPLNLWAP